MRMLIALIILLISSISTANDVLPSHGYSESAVECLALNLFHEARKEPSVLMEKFAIAFVVMNRVKSPRWKGNICDVIKEQAQFSWYHPTEPKRVNWKNKIEVRAWKKAKTEAEWFLALYDNGLISDFTNGADHYHATSVNPWWNSDMKYKGVYGSHVFWFDYKRSK